jgi:hypothetical protein
MLISHKITSQFFVITNMAISLPSIGVSHSMSLLLLHRLSNEGLINMQNCFHMCNSLYINPFTHTSEGQNVNSYQKTLSETLLTNTFWLTDFMKPFLPKVLDAFPTLPTSCTATVLLLSTSSCQYTAWNPCHSPIPNKVHSFTSTLHFCHVRSNVDTAVTMKMAAFWGLLTCDPVGM